MAITFTTIDRTTSVAPAKTSPSAELLAWIASDIEVSLDRLSDLIDARSYASARHELMTVRRMVIDLVELHGQPCSARTAGVFDLAYRESSLHGSSSDDPKA